MNKHLAMYVFVDAFGWEVYQRYGFASDILRNAQPLETTFGFSSAADPSILTGRYPEEHQHWSSFYYNPEESPFKSFKLMAGLPGIVFDRWRPRHWMSKVLARWYGYTGYFEIYSVPFAHLPYFDYLEKRDYFVPGGILATDTIFDWCTEKDIPYYCSNWRHSEEQVVAENLRQIEQGEIRFNYVYLPKLDGLMHNVGTRHASVAAKLNWLEQQLRTLYDTALRHYHDVSVYLISDHGMADVHKGVNIIDRITRLGLDYGTDYVAMYDSTMARFWFLNTDAERKIRNALAPVEDGHFISEEELARMRVHFPDGKFGHAFFLMNPGVMINPSYMGLKVIPGMHGYHPLDKDSYATIASNKPLDAGIRSITDIRKTMEAELIYGSTA